MLRAATRRWAGQSLNFGQLIEVVEAVEARYKKDGYFLAQAYLPPQKIHDGAIEIAISEGQLGATRLEGESRIAPDVLYRYLDRLPKNQALTLPIVERQVLLINELAGARINLDLQAGDQAGSTDVVLNQQTDDLRNWRFEANNYGSPATGVNRFGINLNLNSPFNLGERLTASALVTNTGDLNSYNLRGELPVGGNGWRLSATASRATYSLGGDFTALQASGTADSLRLGVSYPIIRSRLRNLKLQVEADKSNLADHFAASSTDLDKQSHGLTATLSSDASDEWAGGGTTRAELAWRSGQLDLGTQSAALDAPPAGPDTAGSFGKTTLSLERQQNISPRLSLQLGISGQAASKNLDSSEKLSLGGPGSMPGYASGEGNADSGYLIKLSVRWQALPQLAISGLADFASLQLAHNPVPAATTDNQRLLSDIGISADWQVSKAASLSTVWARPGKDATNPADNGKNRLWLSLAYGW
ncbi:heme/hemopexin transporter protein HuxB precursor [mine drainage metagenome]|uniref:Heme/hemopexin transporter protein HuxB n=1 Tax=mine drainage metagenome TaxID=410659 RepID=A0A1J5Q1P7_9ZZZZ